VCADTIPTEADFIRWDVPTWSQAIVFWDAYLARRARRPDERGLEIGGLRGGLSLYMASRHGIAMVCSDARDSRSVAQAHHAQFRVRAPISYEIVNALDIKFPEASFDYVLFKSVLGEIASQDKPHVKRDVIRELYRVLKPGGALLFAENMQGSPLHRLLRSRLRKWGSTWGYTSIAEMQELLKPFHRVDYETAGFLSAMVPESSLKRVAFQIDRAARAFVPERHRYVIYGIAEKA
jgi:ubiquinone/menaquinone biosynthesis C-methylase UbiE